jgi:hypothetical protein
MIGARPSLDPSKPTDPAQYFHETKIFGKANYEASEIRADQILCLGATPGKQIKAGADFGLRAATGDQSTERARELESPSGRECHSRALARCVGHRAVLVKMVGPIIARTARRATAFDHGTLSDS